MGVVPDSAGHHAEAVFLDKNVHGVHYGSRVHGAHVSGLSAGVLAKRHGPPGDAAVVADAVAADRVSGVGGLSRPVGGSHVAAGLPVETRSRTGADRDARDQDEQSAAVTQHIARSRGPSFLVVLAQAHNGRE